tara:strand:- start:44 stop:325 length:282 start_codon:yes stop_codon:yes gene_type:complete
MALTESIEYDKIEVVTKYKAVQVRKATVISRDGVEIPGSRTFFRYVLNCGGLDADGNFVETDVSNEPAEVAAICNAAWTTDVKAAYEAFLKSS